MKNSDKTEEQIRKAREACARYYQKNKRELNAKHVKYQIARYHKDKEYRIKRLAYQLAYSRRKKGDYGYYE